MSFENCIILRHKILFPQISVHESVASVAQIFSRFLHENIITL